MVDLRLAPVLVWVLFWACATAGYLISVEAGFVPECFPHVEGCTTISQSGREGLSFFIFKAVMIPAAVFTMIYWILNHHWLRSMGESTKSIWLTTSFGLVGAIFLIVYLTFLGSDGDVYRMMRRYGTIVFFVFTFIAECMLTSKCWHLFRRNWIVIVKLILCSAVALELVVHGIAKWFLEETRWLENSTEWRSASVLTIYPVLTWLLWRRTGFEIRYGNQANQMDESHQ